MLLRYEVLSHNPMKYFKYLFALVFILHGCSKNETIIPEPVPIPIPETFTEYTIAAGEHYCDKTVIKAVSITKMLFKVKFNSSAIYTNVDPLNQYDINKLYGFTEGYDPHVNSARMGWSYNNGALRLYAYAYNNGQRLSEEISAVNIGETLNCSIKLDGNHYIFTVNDKQVKLARALSGPIAEGYQLFPYFGGDETAPHAIRISIKDL